MLFTLIPDKYQAPFVVRRCASIDIDFSTINPYTKYQTSFVFLLSSVSFERQRFLYNQPSIPKSIVAALLTINTEGMSVNDIKSNNNKRRGIVYTRGEDSCKKIDLLLTELLDDNSTLTLKVLCNLHRDLCGDPRSTTRKSVSNRFNYLKRKKESDPQWWIKHLKSLGIANEECASSFDLSVNDSSIDSSHSVPCLVIEGKQEKKMTSLFRSPKGPGAGGKNTLSLLTITCLINFS
jgi:hypothetical protein